ncbi:MAG: thioredoxin domain-containing protein [Acidobacteria bacterium]|nr:thioredoxin domain-containing protein [Acidobacteriota bacterium]
MAGAVALLDEAGEGGGLLGGHMADELAAVVGLQGELRHIINRHVIAIKVDRDERPDVDARYQSAVQAISGQGGWPLTAFLTPDGQVSFGGTYFPPIDAYGRPSFKRVLLSAAKYYQENREEAVRVAGELARQIGSVLAGVAPSGLEPSLVDRPLKDILRAHDPVNGGFGRAPKFTHPGTIDLLIGRAFRAEDECLRDVVTRTLVKMGRGGFPRWAVLE